MADQYVASATRCEHGNPLRKSCPICQRDDEITDLKMRLGFHAMNRETIIRQASEIRKQAAEIAKLKRGEFICRSCLLRKDAEPEIRPEVISSGGRVNHEF